MGTFDGGRKSIEIREENKKRGKEIRPKEGRRKGRGAKERKQNKTKQNRRLNK